MSKVKVAAFSISLDGFGAGPGQDLKNPLGVRGHELHSWLFPTETFQRLTGKSSGSVGVDNDFAAQSFENVGAWIMGRNMFGPIRGPWQDDSWKGWGGHNPPYHTPVFVLTHHLRADLLWKVARPSILLRMGRKRLWREPRRQQTEKTFESAVAFQCFANTWP